MKKNIALITVYSVILMSAAFSTVAKAGAPASAAACAACHGPNGNSTNPLFPVLAGQHAAYLKKQLLDFQSGARKDPTMSAMAKPLTKAQIEEIAKYFSKQ